MTDKNAGNSLTEMAKRILMAGLGSAVQAKDMISDGRLQKELIGTVLLKAEKRKDELMEILAREVGKFLSKVKVSEEIAKALGGMVINLSATVDFTPSKKGSTPQVKINPPKITKRRKK